MPAPARILEAQEPPSHSLERRREGNREEGSVGKELVRNRREVQGLYLTIIQEPIPDTLQTRGQVHFLDAAGAQKAPSHLLQLCPVPQVDHLEPGA
jgi:hypothetical protein